MKRAWVVCCVLAIQVGACADSEPQPAEAGGAGGAAPGGSAAGAGDGDGGEGGEGGTGVGGAGGMGVDVGVEIGPGVYMSPTELEPGSTATIRYRGALTNEASVTVHYGFNGWNATGTAGRVSEDDGTGNQDFFFELPMTPMQDGHEVNVDIPSDARAIHLVFTDGTSWDNNAGLDYNRGVRFPYIGPYLGIDASVAATSGVVVSFVTGHACIGRVEHGPSTALGTTVNETSAETVHHILVDGLSPGSETFYRVGCDTLIEDEVHSFVTAATGADDYTFVVLGDMQDEGETGRWQDVANELTTSHDDVAFAVIAGDMAWNDRPGLWWTFFDKGHTFFASKVMLPAAGNHDTPGVGSNDDLTSFERYFPVGGTYYRRAWGNAEIIALNSERVSELAMSGGAQYSWAQQQLSTVSSDWVFAFWHIPPYNAGNRHWTQQGEIRDLTGLFDEKVDWVFCGHEHLYQRTQPLRYNGQLAGSYGNGASDGVGYVVVPPAGVWPGDTLIPHDDPKGYYRDRLAYPVVSPPSDTAPSEIGFVLVDVTGKSVALTTYGLGTITQPQAVHVVDQASYTKP